MKSAEEMDSDELNRAMKNGPEEFYKKCRLEIAQMVTLMAEIFNRKLSDGAVAFWVEELFPHYGSRLGESMREAMRDKFMPAINAIIENVKAKEHRREREEFMEQVRKAEEREHAARRAHGPSEEEANIAAENFFATMREKLGIKEPEKMHIGDIDDEKLPF